MAQHAQGTVHGLVHQLLEFLAQGHVLTLVILASDQAAPTLRRRQGGAAWSEARMTRVRT